MVKIKEVINHLETIAPLAFQESYDNCGLLVGSYETELTGILISLDVTEEVVEEAIRSKCNMIIAHHPVIFKGLKKLTGSNYIERTVLKAIKNDIAIYAIHTNLDNLLQGVNHKIAEKIGLKDLKVLVPKLQTLKKLVTFIPLKNCLEVLKAIHEAGAGKIGNYSECSFQVEGLGSFRPNEEADPAIGKANELEQVKEMRAEVIFPAYLEGKILKALLNSHPYEEPAFDIQSLDNANKEVGSGIMGVLEKPMDEHEFLLSLKEKMNLKVIRHTKILNKKVSKIAICGGSGSFLLGKAITLDNQVFITADFKYHEFFDAENKIIIADIGHYESEVYTKELIYELLIDKFSNIALVLAKTHTNPISYL
jgi:dinuclear metal center YbgI/SA1388 family protein